MVCAARAQSANGDAGLGLSGKTKSVAAGALMQVMIQPASTERRRFGVFMLRDTVERNTEKPRYAREKQGSSEA
jgi:hypothetical protein